MHILKTPGKSFSEKETWKSVCTLAQAMKKTNKMSCLSCFPRQHVETRRRVLKQWRRKWFFSLCNSLISFQQAACTCTACVKDFDMTMPAVNWHTSHAVYCKTLALVLVEADIDKWRIAGVERGWGDPRVGGWVGFNYNTIQYSFNEAWQNASYTIVRLWKWITISDC